MSAIGDHKELNVFKQPRAAPETFPAIAVDLVKCFAQGDPTALKLNVDHREAVDQNGNVIAGGMPSTRCFVLVKHLQPVVVDVVFIDQTNVYNTVIIASQQLHKILLNFEGFFGDAFAGVGDFFSVKPLPFSIAETELVQCFQLHTQVVYQRGFTVNLDKFIALFFKLLDKFPLQVSFALVAVGAVRIGGAFCHDRGFIGGGDNVVKGHF